MRQALLPVQLWFSIKMTQTVFTLLSCALADTAQRKEQRYSETEPNSLQQMRHGDIHGVRVDSLARKPNTSPRGRLLRGRLAMVKTELMSEGSGCRRVWLHVALRAWRQGRRALERNGRHVGATARGRDVRSPH